MPEEASLKEEDRYTVFHPGEVELASTIKKLLAEIERVGPDRLVIDSLAEFRLLAQDPIRYRRQLLALKQYFAGRNATVLLLDDQSHGPESEDQQVLSIVHGVIRLSRVPRTYGVTRRHLEVTKVRSSGYREGFHDYTLAREGMVSFPRLIAAEHGKNFEQEFLLSNIPGLEAMFAGGIHRGSSTLILGPSGVGKSSLAMQYAGAAAMRKERVVVYSFDETLRTTKQREQSLGMAIDKMLKSDHLCIEQMDAAEISPGEFAWKIRREVEERNARVIVIDSLNGFLLSMTGEFDLPMHLHELLSFLNQRGVNTFLILSQQGMIGDHSDWVDVSYLTDSLLLLRYFELDASMRRSIAVVKKRSGAHEKTIRELQFSPTGIQIGEPLVGYKGILSGLPDSIQMPQPQNGDDQKL